MKKLIVFFIAGAFVSMVAAQNDEQQIQQGTTISTTTKTENMGVQPQPGKTYKTTTKEYVEMKHGKLMHYKEKTTTQVNERLSLGGATVNSDGTVTLGDGRVVTLHEGDRITWEGKLERSTERARAPEDMDKY